MNKLIVAVLACFIMAFAATSADARAVVGISVDGGHYRHHHHYHHHYYYEQPTYYRQCYVDIDDEVICHIYRYQHKRVIYYY